MTTHTAYISTGATNAMYTLRVCQKVDPSDKMSARFARDYYIANLSTDLDKAVNMLADYCARTGMKNGGHDSEGLRKIEVGKGSVSNGDWRKYKDMEDGVMPFGKHEGEKFEDIPASYLVFMADKVLGSTKPYELLFKELVPCFPHVIEYMAEAEERQKAYEAKIAEEKANAKPIPVTDKRIKITGEILSVKSQESDWGYLTKILVKDDSGFKVYGTMGNSFAIKPDADGYIVRDGENFSYPQKGDRVSFMCKVTASDDDETFGFFKRPTKPEMA